MIAISQREKLLLGATLLVLMYGFLGLTLKKHLAAFSGARAEYENSRATLTAYEDLLSQRADWEAQYAEVESKMPVFDETRRVDTYWLGIMDSLAATNNISIIRRQLGEEVRDGDVYELAIDCRDWEGNLAGLVGFFHDMHAAGAMLDIRKLSVRPNTNRKNGAPLRGTFTLYCAFMRDDDLSAATSQATTTNAVNNVGGNETFGK